MIAETISLVTLIKSLNHVTLIVIMFLWGVFLNWRIKKLEEKICWLTDTMLQVIEKAAAAQKAYEAMTERKNGGRLLPF